MHVASPTTTRLYPSPLCTTALFTTAVRLLYVVNKSVRLRCPPKKMKPAYYYRGVSEFLPRFNCNCCFIWQELPAQAVLNSFQKRNVVEMFSTLGRNFLTRHFRVWNYFNQFVASLYSRTVGVMSFKEGKDSGGGTRRTQSSYMKTRMAATRERPVAGGILLGAKTALHMASAGEFSTGNKIPIICTPACPRLLPGIPENQLSEHGSSRKLDAANNQSPSGGKH